MKAPFPWFGGKRAVAPFVWERFGDVPNYVEPFAGSLAVLLERPTAPRCETVNDKDGYLANFWRAMAHDARGVCRHADWPVNEADLHARHQWLQARRVNFTERLMSQPGYYDVKVAGWWVWGLSMWIGGGWCGEASQRKTVRQRQSVERGSENGAAWRKRPWMKRGGAGVQRRRPMDRAGLATLRDQGVNVHRTKPDLSGSRGVQASALLRGPGPDGAGGLREYFEALQARLRRVRVCCGDFRRVLGHSPTTAIGLTAVLLDPPYKGELRDEELYAEEGLDIAAAARDWAVAHGHDPLLRIALCGLEGEHAMPRDWTMMAWQSQGGYSNQSKVRAGQAPSRAQENRSKERIWFSPHCLQTQQTEFFA